jgi:hypothetical protein
MASRRFSILNKLRVDQQWKVMWQILWRDGR